MSRRQSPFADAQVRAVFDAYPPALRRELRALRALILATAAERPQVGPLIETLKWGQPAYLPARPRTTLAEQFRSRYRGQFTFEGDRALVFAAGQTLPRDALAHCIGLALTYHLPQRGLP